MGDVKGVGDHPRVHVPAEPALSVQAVPEVMKFLDGRFAILTVVRHVSLAAFGNRVFRADALQAPYSVLWCADCAYPQPWTIAALPPPLDAWAGAIVLSIFGIAVLQRAR